MKITNKDVIQSYIVTAARYDFDVYEKRIVYRLVEMCQDQIEGKKLNAGFRIDPLIFNEMKEITIPISSFLKDEEDQNYTRAKEALRSLRNKTFEYSTPEKPWKLIGLIEMPEFNSTGFAKFRIHKEVYEAILNFSKGFRKLELQTAMSFDTVYAMRFYELFSGKKEPITYKIEDLKIMFHLENKYKLNADFIKRVIEPAKKEMDEKAPYSFTYKKNIIGRKLISLTFFPYSIHKNRDEKLEMTELKKQLSISTLDKMIVNYLKENYYFSSEEIKNNMDTFLIANKQLPDIMNFLANKRRAASDKKNPKGWLISAIKSELVKVNSN